MRDIENNSPISVWLSLSFKYSKLFAMINCVSSSDALANAMYRNCLNSDGLFRAAPSAILEGIDTADLRICDVKP